MYYGLSRRSFIAAVAALGALPASPAPARRVPWVWSLPIGRPDRVPGDGFIIRHGFATENTWYFPGAWHAGEDYYALEGDTAGSQVYASADGEIVYAAFDYPGRVVIVRHADDLYSMYGHLDDDLAATEGPVMRGQMLGTVLDRTDGRAPSHLHFEIRRFYTTPDVNGSTPRYGFACGVNCPPGPGYWPVDAPEHPVGMGWLNPLHLMAQRWLPNGVPDSDAHVTVAQGIDGPVEVWASPDGGTEPIGEQDVQAGGRFRLREVAAGTAGTTATSAEAYRLWYRIEVPGYENPVWVEGVTASLEETGSDGRPSSIRFRFLPGVPGATSAGGGRGMRSGCPGLDGARY